MILRHTYGNIKANKSQGISQEQDTLHQRIV